MNHFAIERLLKQYWRSQGNPRLKGLFLAASDETSAKPSEVGRAWITNSKERETHLEQSDQPKALRAPVSQQYSPARHADFETSKEANTARALSKRLLKGKPNESDSEAAKFLAGDKTVDKDTYIKRALLNESETELDVLFREELATSIIMGAQPRKVFREASNEIPVSKRKGDLPRGTDENYAQTGGQGSEIGTGEEGFDTVAYDCVKISQGFEISDELIDEAEPAVLEHLARQTGAAVENTITRLGIYELIENAGQNFDSDFTNSTNTPVQSLNGAAGLIDLQDFGPADTALVHPEFETELFDDTNVVYANRGGSTEPVRDRELGSVMGLERFMVSDGSYNNATDQKHIRSTSETWGYNADTEEGAVVYERDRVNFITYSEFDMVTKEYDDPIRDLQGMNVRGWYDVAIGQTNAVCTVEY